MVHVVWHVQQTMLHVLFKRFITWQKLYILYNTRFWSLVIFGTDREVVQYMTLYPLNDFTHYLFA